MVTVEQAGYAALAIAACSLFGLVLYACLRMARRADDQAEADYQSVLRHDDQADAVPVLQHQDVDVARRDQPRRPLTRRDVEARRASSFLTRGY